MSTRPRSTYSGKSCSGGEKGKQPKGAQVDHASKKEIDIYWVRDASINQITYRQVGLRGNEVVGMDNTTGQEDTFYYHITDLSANQAYMFKFHFSDATVLKGLIKTSLPSNPKYLLVWIIKYDQNSPTIVEQLPNHQNLVGYKVNLLTSDNDMHLPAYQMVLYDWYSETLKTYCEANPSIGLQKKKTILQQITMGVDCLHNGTHDDDAKTTRGFSHGFLDEKFIFLSAHGKWIVGSGDPENYQNGDYLRKANMDMGLLGRIFFCILSEPISFSIPHKKVDFQNHAQRIYQKIPDASFLHQIFAPKDYVKTKKVPKTNIPKTNDVLNYPLFWDSRRKLDFIKSIDDCHGKCQRECLKVEKGSIYPCCETPGIYFNNITVFQEDWRGLVHDGLIEEIIRRIRTNGKNEDQVFKYLFGAGLIRQIRNLHKHYNEIQDLNRWKSSIKRNNIWDYFEERFPYLLIVSYAFIKSLNFHTHYEVAQYFQGT